MKKNYILSITLLVLFLFLISSVSAYSYKYQKIDTRTTEEKYYYSYQTHSQYSTDNPSLWRYKQVYNPPKIPRNETPYSQYYYSPRYDSLNDHWQWRF